MKKTSLTSSIFVLMMLAIAATVSLTQPKKPVPPLRGKAASYLNRTNIMLKKTSTQVKQGKVYTGHLAKAKKVQKGAIQSFKQNKYRIAIEKSHVARKLAMKSFTANGGTVPAQWQPNAAEKTLNLPEPSEADMAVSEAEKAGEEAVIEEVTEDVSE
jgi:hypothetical protein